MRNPAAFSLLETVLALAIVSTVLVAAMALIPLGLQAAHDAERRTAEWRILQNVRDLCDTSVPGGIIPFSRNGSPLPGRSADTGYTATIQPGAGISLPGNPDRLLRCVTVEIRDSSPSWRFARTLVLRP